MPKKDRENPKVVFDNSTLLSVSATTGSKIVEQLGNIEGKYEKRMKILIEENEKLKKNLKSKEENEISPETLNTLKTKLNVAEEEIDHLRGENK